MKLIDANKLYEQLFYFFGSRKFESTKTVLDIIALTHREEAIPTEQLLSILPKYDDYIHTKTYPYDETMEDIYSKGHEEGWNACLNAIKEELDDWEKENETKPVKHGHWIFNPKDAIEMMFTLPKCSECGAESPNGGNYCPNCGARMNAERKEE